MRRVLRTINEAAEMPSMDDHERYALKQCIAEGYIDGVCTETMASGRIVVEFSSPRVTISGLKFLYPYKDWKFVLPTIIAVLELIAIIIQSIVGC